jgi:hypothetical protein
VELACKEEEHPETYKTKQQAVTAALITDREPTSSFQPAPITSPIQCLFELEEKPGPVVGLFSPCGCVSVLAWEHLGCFLLFFTSPQVQNSKYIHIIARKLETVK